MLTKQQLFLLFTFIIFRLDSISTKQTYEKLSSKKLQFGTTSIELCNFLVLLE